MKQGLPSGHADHRDSKTAQTGSDPSFNGNSGKPRVVGLSDWRPALPSAIAARNWLAGQADWIRCSILSEPRGCESTAGAYVCQPVNADAVAAVVFFKNTGNSFASDILGLPANRRVSSDVAQGGNWLFLVQVDQVDARFTRQLLDDCKQLNKRWSPKGLAEKAARKSITLN